MANGKITLGKQSGGVLSLTFPDGVTNTEVVLPESGELVNKDYVDTRDAQNVKLTGNQTISGVKTFSSSPIVPTPTVGTEAVNKDYADLKVALASFIGTNQSKVINGYQKLPGGLIIQWGSSVSTTNAGGGSGVTYPITFPTFTFQPIICNGDNNVALHNLSVISSQVSTSGFGWVSDLANTEQRLNWFAIGY